MKTIKLTTNFKSLLPALFLNFTILILWPVYATNDVWVDNGDGTVSDVATGLIWEQILDGSANNYSEAITYCDNLSLAGYTDWRLPDVKELTSVVDYRNDQPAVDAGAFPATNNIEFWSSSEFASDTSQAWRVDFVDGRVIASNKAVDNLARCVR